MTKTKSDEPELEIKAKLKGFDKAKDWNWSSRHKNKHKGAAHGMGGILYFIGFAGSIVYWMQAAQGFGAVTTGFLKSLIWPAYIVYKLLESFYGVVN